MTDKKNPFSIITPVAEEIEESSFVDGIRLDIEEEEEPDIKTPIERMIQKELKTDKFVLAYYDEEGNIGFYTGEGLGPEEISFVTDVMKARVMLQLLLE